MTAHPTAYPDLLEWLFARSRRGAPRDPARMAALIAALALPMPPRTVHVVGSNGKGSTAAMIQAGLTAVGQRTGLFVSPHVEDFRERISVDGEQISQDEVVWTLSDWRARSLSLEPAFFEWTLALALSHFGARNVDAAVIEAGIGAARDATLTVENVAVSVLTSVALEHQAVLGPTLEGIARDKAEVVRPGVPLVTGVSGVALEVIRETCAARGSPLYADQDELSRDKVNQSQNFALPTDIPLLHPPARTRNARLAAAALRLLGANEVAVRAAVSSPPLPARREVFIVQGRTVILDGAHNPAALDALSSSLAPGFVLLYGALPHKQGAAGLAVLSLQAASVILTDAGGEASALATPGHIYHPDPKDALKAALEATPEGGTLLVTGSFYLAGEVRPLLRARVAAAVSPRSPR